MKNTHNPAHFDPNSVAITNPHPQAALVWLLTSIGRSHRRMLSALIGMANDEGSIQQVNEHPISQHVAEIAKQSPNYANRVINELIWYGLIKPSKHQHVLNNGKGKLIEELHILGLEHYSSPAVQAVLNSEQVTGMSPRAMDSDWSDKLALLG